jgi:hypothetical protein
MSQALAILSSLTGSPTDIKLIYMKRILSLTRSTIFPQDFAFLHITLSPQASSSQSESAGLVDQGVKPATLAAIRVLVI